MSIDMLPVRKHNANGNRFGWVRDMPDPRDLVREPTEMELLSLPKAIRWDETPRMPGVYDQGQLGSCTGNGIAGAYQFDLKSEGRPDFTPARLFIYYNERKIEGTVGSDSGAQIRDGIKSVASVGVAPETIWPYDIAQFAVQPPAAAYLAAEAHKAIVYQAVQQDAMHIQAAVAAGHLVVFGVTLWESFEDVSSNGMVPMPDTGQSPIGGHCMAVAGYATINGVLYARVRNSWGPGWADGGYCWMPMQYLTSSLASDLWVLQTVD